MRQVVHVTQLAQGGKKSLVARLANGGALGHGVLGGQDGLLDGVGEALEAAALDVQARGRAVAAGPVPVSRVLAGGEGKPKGGKGPGGLGLELASAVVQLVLGTGRVGDGGSTTRQRSTGRHFIS